MTLGLQIIQSNFAVEQDGTEDKEIVVERGGFWTRLFDPDPTIPLWQKTKTNVIQVPRYRPVIYKMMNKLIVHPSLMTSLTESIIEFNKSPDVFRW